MRNMLVLTALAVAGCGGSQKPLVPEPKGYAEHMAAADEHARRAQVHREAAARIPETGINRQLNYQCGDTVLSDQTTSGGQRVVESIPCWDRAEEQAEHHRFLAAREQRRARDERAAAARLVEAERLACQGLPAEELEHSPFAHRKSIAAVIPHRESNVVRGVRIVFKPVPGLTADWMRRAIACHRARFERLGEPPTYLPEDPTLVAGATATVQMRAGQIEVLVTAPTQLGAAVAVGRARDLVNPQTATR